MKRSTLEQSESEFLQHFKCLRNAAQPWLAGAVGLFAALSASGGNFSANFNSGLPSNTAVYGNASVLSSGGYTNSGYLQITPDALSQEGSFVITRDLDAGSQSYSFDAQFKAFIGGGTGANGFGFDYMYALPGGLFAESGPGYGLDVTFRTYVDSSPEVVGIEIWSGGSMIASQPFPNLRMDAWVDASVQLHPDGTLDVYYDNFHAFSNYNVGYTGPFSGWYFGLGGRTGGLDDNHGVDNLNINTDTNAGPFVDNYYPFGDQVRPDSPVQINLTDYNTQVNTNAIALQLDGVAVTPTITQSSPQTTVLYTPASYFVAGSLHTVSITYADNSTPTPITNTFQYPFTVATYTVLSNPASPTLVSATPGFNIRSSQINADLGDGLQRAELQLANELINPTTGQPYVNQATLTSEVDTNTINFSTAGYEGDFPTELPDSIPGLPGSTGGDTNAALDAVTYLYLPAGFYTLGVNSSDGFGLTAATTPDVFATELMEYNGIRSSSDSFITFQVTNAGYYPFRLLYFVGGTGVPNPTSDNPDLEFFSVNALGAEILVNDNTTPGYVAAYTPAATLPYISAVTPTPSSTGVPYNTAVTATLVNGTITVQTNTIQLWFNGSLVTPTISASSGTTTVNYQPSQLPLNSTNTVQIAFTDSASNKRTNSWSFVVENILQQLWTIPPGSATNATWAEWVTAGSTERGLAYNPQTGHVLLVSRSATGPGANGGVGIFDGNTGAFLGTMDVSQSSGGVGTFHLSMISVAEDGVVYACNLTTSATTAFCIYRWQNETSPQQLVYSQNPLDGAARCGDSFRAENSGIGTRIVACGNVGSPVQTGDIPVFTTVDGTNFTATDLIVTGEETIPADGWFRLGLAFGCGNTFYGQTIGSPTIYTAFTGPPSSRAAQVQDLYPIAAFDGSLSLGPIGVDIANQRLIADETSGANGTTHSMNLYNLSKFTGEATNIPIDHKTFATSTGSFGTGSVDFTPNGTRVYTLDTGNGIIAFTLNPNVSALDICSDPQNDLIAGVGSPGYMDVRATGAPQQYQWYFSTNPATLGTAVAGATNRTLDFWNTQTNQLGNYRVVISNATLATSVTSSSALLDTEMGFSTEPAGQQVSPDGPATFTAAVTNGLPAYHYQWTLNGVNIPGATASSYTVGSAQSSNAGDYEIVVTDAVGQSVTSSPALLYINGTPQIVTDIQPTSLTLPVGNMATFTVSASGATSYQWLFNNSPIVNNYRASGAQTPTLTINNCQVTDSGVYQLELSNSVGYSYSSSASLAVTLITFNNGGGWSANGNAIVANGALELTEGPLSQNSTFWLDEQVNVQAFRASWIYQDNTGGAGANGVVFCLQNMGTNAFESASGGGQMGYEGIVPSVALGFNIYPNYTVGIQLTTNDFVVPFSTTGSVSLVSGDAIAVSVLYLNNVLSLGMTDTITGAAFSTNYSINIPNTVGSNVAYVGFTGASGGVGSDQVVSDFLFTNLVTLNAQNLGGGALSLTWLEGTAGLVLQQSSSLAASSWVNVTNEPAIVNNQNQLTVTPSGKAQFYRLGSQ